MHVQQQSTSLTLSIIITLAILSAATTAITPIKSTQARLEGFATPAAVTATATAGLPSSSSSSSSEKEFSARLTGDKEVPPVDTDTTGRIRLTANSQQDALDYQLSVSNLNGVATGAHIHTGSTGTNGPVVANLNIRGTFAGASASASAGGSDGSAMTSTSTGGTITSADLKGPLAGKQVSDLIQLIEDGKAYVNVHTTQHPNGEIRGQLTSSSSSSSDTGNQDDGSLASATASISPSASASATAP
jgi:hypothetical protein